MNKIALSTIAASALAALAAHSAPMPNPASSYEDYVAWCAAQKGGNGQTTGSRPQQPPLRSPVGMMYIPEGVVNSLPPAEQNNLRAAQLATLFMPRTGGADVERIQREDREQTAALKEEKAKRDAVNISKGLYGGRIFGFMPDGTIVTDSPEHAAATGAILLSTEDFRKGFVAGAWK